MEKILSFYLIALVSLPSIATVNDLSRHQITSGFTENNGQVADLETGEVNKAILYSGKIGSGAKIYFHKNKLSYVLNQKVTTEEKAYKQDKKTPAGGLTSFMNVPQPLSIHRIDMEFKNCNPNATLVAENKTSDYTRYYLPHCKDGVTAYSYSKLTYKNIYPNIDIVFKKVGNDNLEYDFVLNPGANVADIQLTYKGTENISLDKQLLSIKTNMGEIQEHIPEIYQIINGQKVLVQGGYELKKNADGNNDFTVQFKLAQYNHASTLIIDPWVEIYGGSDNETARAIKTDNTGNVIFVGETSSDDFPTSIGLYKGGTPFIQDAFLVKLDPNGVRLWGLLYGGKDGDAGYGVDVDTQDNIVIVGITRSVDLPVSAGAFQQVAPSNLPDPNNPGTLYQDGFLVKFTPNGTRVFGTYYGGEREDYFLSIATDKADNIFISAATNSTNFSTAGHFQNAINGTNLDAAIVKFNANATGTLAWATYYGGSDFDAGQGIEVDSQSNIIITGYTSSTDFPVSAGALHPTYSGGLCDAFVVKMDSNGTTRQFGTYYGGNDIDFGNSVAIDNLDNIIFAGSTASNDFPTAGAFQSSFGGVGVNSGEGDAFLVKLDPTGGITWGTYLGGSDDDVCRGIITDATNNIYIGGHTYSNNFPTTNCAYKTYMGEGSNDGSADSFVASFDNNGNSICSSYIGVDGMNELTYGYSTVAMNGGNLYLLGIANIYGTYPYTIDTYQTSTFWSLFTPDDIFVGQICLTSCGYKYSADQLGFTSNEDSICTGTTVYYTITSVCHVNSYNWEFSGGVPATSTSLNPSVTYNSPGTYEVKLYLNTTCGNDSVIKNSMTVIVDPTCCDLFMPVAFTPNDDGLNDVFYVAGTSYCIQDFDLKIFDRWGELVHESHDINTGWDGTYSNKKTMTGVFVYTFKATLISGKEIDMKGHLVLLK